MNKPYNLLLKEDKEKIITTYYDIQNIKLTFKEMADLCNVSERAFSRVLVESGINTKLKNRYLVKNESYFNNINTENKAYFLGLLFADGYVGNENQIIITLKNVENTIDILNLFISEIEANINIQELIVKNGFETSNTFLKLSFSNEIINSSLKKLGLGNHKETSRTVIPKDVITNNLESHFIRGLYDGDGSFYIKNKNMPTPQKTVSFMGNLSLLEQIKHILESELQLNNTKIRVSTNSKKVSELRYGGNKQVARIRKYLYGNSHIYLKHKKF